MTGIDALRREVEALRERSSQLNTAILRISASLDVDTVLNEVVASARTLTAARYGTITTADDKGRLQDFVASGFASEELREMTAWSEGPRLFEQLRDLHEPLRLADFPAWVHSLGLSPEPIPGKTLQATPMRYRGQYLGALCLSDKEGGEQFTSKDEEIMALFAGQAATALANARTYRAEQRARADLEALVDTSPVGVAVFDARTGRLASSNREVNRIGSRLCAPGQSVEQMLVVATCRFGDGREVSFAELPMSQVLSNADTVRAEQVELAVPDGRCVAALINVTPIKSADETVESVIVTLQDLAALDELERSRTEFLSMVSHELRAPLTSIKGSSATALSTSRILDPAEVRQLFRIIDDQANRMDRLLSDLLDAGRIETGTLSVTPAAVEVGALVDQARNTFLSGGGRHTLEIDLPPDLPRVMADERRIVQVLNNLVSNAARHSPETAPIRIDVARDGIHVAISVSDKGAGVPPEVLPHLFSKYAGVDAGETVREGHGLGLAICKGLVEAHGGRIRATSGGRGQGARFTFTLMVAPEAGEGTGARIDPGSPDPAGNRAERARILVLDDDPETLRHVRAALAEAGYAPLVSGDPEELPSLLRKKRPDLVLLDLMLPGTDGIELMERVAGLADLPVIFISGYRRDETIARALGAGAVDYIVKPFSPTELTARVQAALRQRAHAASFALEELTIDYDRRRVSLAGQVLDLSATEYDLLRVLSLDAGRVVTHDTLLRRVWGNPSGDGAHIVRTYVKKLRRKLGDDARRPTYIFNELRVGYRMPDPNEPGENPPSPATPS